MEEPGGTCFKQNGQIVALSIAIHVGLSEPEVAHRAEVYPECRIEDPELYCQLGNWVLFVCRRPRWGENINVSP